MRKVLGLICFIIGLCVVFAACSSSETYADKLKNERKNISRFINEHNIVVLNQYPASGVFKENEYFRDPLTGVYINVIDSGNGNRASSSKRSEVNVRFWDAMTLPTADSDTISNNVAGLQPISLTYGIVATYSSSNTNSLDYYYLSTGITAPLQYVGENARVRLIVPFATGSTYQLAAFKAMYYTQLQYTRIVN
ncbi:DUF4827 domain-containing protein [Dysgonomonas sp. HDW5B]|uniref:DUF4827 domain-containing protein n=1 Tax=Dysgonomonas sp. HDW5B TaxID=2714927 RepID=UPI001409B6AA|nr:DUF4827 domain-containing protein [Dysgonomonas sp. HDW5B]QIK53749.1 DUF4827 domain-containing protein [Dysgonomonas sp. HDW5B]